MLTNFIAEKVALKIQGNPSSADIQDGFKSIDNVANVFGSSGGSKYKTKKFRLTKKRKTRKSMKPK